MNQRIFCRFGATAVAMLLLRPLHAAAIELTDPATIRAAAEESVRAAAGTATTGQIGRAHV